MRVLGRSSATWVHYRTHRGKSKCCLTVRLIRRTLQISLRERPLWGSSLPGAFSFLPQNGPLVINIGDFYPGTLK
jgi:hypothetical protein